MTLGLCGNIDLSPLADALDRQSTSADILVGKPHAFALELQKTFADVSSLETCIIALDWRDFAPEVYRFGFGDNTKKLLRYFADQCNQLSELISQFRSVCSARLLLFSPLTDADDPTGFLSRLLHPSPVELFYTLQQQFNALCRSHTDCYPIDIDRLANTIGRERAINHTTLAEQPQPFTPRMTNAIAVHITAILTQLNHYPLKCIVLDMDNTIWGGVVSDIGREQLLIGDTGVGKAFKEFQSYLVRLYKQGVLLAICSKNNTCDVLEVLERHSEMLIRPSMIACYRINWDDKPKNMVEISRELNIGLNAILFIDDSPFERHCMTAALPAVTTLALPKNPAGYTNALAQCTRLWPVQLTHEDVRKGNAYLQTTKRNDLEKQALNREAYLTSLAIKVCITQASAVSFPRIAQLLNKTNQFNLTTKRYTQLELETFAQADRHNHVWCLQMEDTLGSCGIIATGVVAGETIDAFVLSCRAFGRQSEIALLHAILRSGKEAGYSAMYGTFLASERNGMAQYFYRDAGFDLIEKEVDGSRWGFDLKKALPKVPGWIQQAVNT